MRGVHRRLITILLCLTLGSLAGGVATRALAADPVLVGAGDIASCSTSGDEATAALLDSIPGEVATFGDNVYPDGTKAEFDNCYDPSWGRHKARTHPATGNHEYNTAGAAGYFQYFGAAAGDPAQGYYSYDLGAWHIIVLNSNCSFVRCQAGSPQERWLRADLAAHPATCTLAYWHHPLFNTSGGGSTAVRPFWDALYSAGADVVLNGHENSYHRFAPQDPAGHSDSTSGIREFIVGTGGVNTSEAGVLKLTLHASSYDWEYIPVPGQKLTDSGSASCSPLPTLPSSPTPTATSTPTSSPTPKATPTPTSSPTSTATPTPTSSPTPKATSTPTATPTPTSSPTPKATSTPTATPTPTSSPAPKATPTDAPVATSHRVYVPMLITSSSGASPLAGSP
jgi:hypothetical protein